MSEEKAVKLTVRYPTANEYEYIEVEATVKAERCGEAAKTILAKLGAAVPGVRHAKQPARSAAKTKGDKITVSGHLPFDPEYKENLGKNGAVCFKVNDGDTDYGVSIFADKDGEYPAFTQRLSKGVAVTVSGDLVVKGKYKNIYSADVSLDGADEEPPADDSQAEDDNLPW